MSDEKEYREGDQENPEPAEETPESGEQEQEGDAEVPQLETEQAEATAEGAETGDVPVEGVPVTAFLVLVHEAGRIDAIVGIPDEIKRQRNATLRDVRDAAAALHDDALITMIVGGCAESMGKSMAKAAEAYLVQRMRAQMGGVTPQ